MEYNLITNIKDCYIQVPQLLYYSHIPTAFVSLVVGLFVILKNKKNLSAKILFFISVVFSTWSLFDIILWVGHDSQTIMFFWAMWSILFSLLFFLSFYFIYVFIKKVDTPLFLKIIALIFFMPILFLTPTTYNLKGFETVSCGALENIILLNYTYFLSAIVFSSIIIFAIVEYRKAQKEFKKQIILATLGVLSFLLMFFFVTYIASLESLFNSSVYSFTMEQYGFFGMPIFIAFLGYLIVKYKAFNIKLIGAQALVVTLIILVGSQFFFADNTTSIVLTGITLALSLGFGYVLIKSIQKEVERKEQLQLMADSLAIANDKLRILDKAKTEFISIASHQLRTPVTAIKGFSSLLLEGSYGEVSATVKGALEKVYVSSERLVNLIEDLLNVSRIESGRLTFTFEMGSVNDILQELYDSFILVAKAKKFYLDLKVPENPLPKIKMDAAKIRELISNFIDNAFKYTEKGGVTVKAEIRESGVVIDEDGFVKEGEKSSYGKVVRVTVSDTGIGVPREEIPSLFKKFSRGKDVSRLHVGGTGLGLFVGKAIADAHHGATWVESDGEGKGSRFIIEIPLNAE